MTPRNSTAVIASRVAGIPELVDAQCGWLIPAGDEEALSEAIADALRATPEELMAKGAVGHERVQRLHDAGANAALLVQCIAESRTLA